WREQLAWLAPHYMGFGALAGAVVICERLLGPAGILVFAVPLLLLWIGEQQYLSRSRAGVQAVRERNDELEAANVRIRDLLERAHSSYLQAITTLGHALQARDPEAAGRTERVSQLSRIIGEAMAMNEADLHALTIGVVVHDIGRVCLRRGEPLVQVPQLSAQILDPLELPLIVKEMARHHLERYDGLGGPDGLAADTIPLAARIVALADALDDLTTPTAAGPALPLQEAMAELGQESGTRFCPQVFAALQRSLAVDPTLRRYFGERPGDGVPQAA
ncbi:MAG: chemotaxis protein CheY, partial [Solirubrobacteraceae bacterium]|nr:chemotaxis protein CheY [Solirubrobacteraceae bacterium]